MNRIKRYTEQVFAEHKAEFGLDFAENRKALKAIAIVRSKELQNEIAGYITRTLKREKHEIEERRRRAAADAAQEQAAAEAESKPEEPEAAVESADGKAFTDGAATVKQLDGEVAGTAMPDEADAEAAEASAVLGAADAESR